MVTTDTRATPHPDVIYTPLDNREAVLLHLGTSTYYTLNETGAQIWHLMSEGFILGQIGEYLEREFEVTLEQAQRSVIDLANQLAAEELVYLNYD